MQLILIIFGIIILVSFITGIILTISEKKKTKPLVFTDDPKILFDDENKETAPLQIFSQDGMTISTIKDDLDTSSRDSSIDNNKRIQTLPVMGKILDESINDNNSIENSNSEVPRFVNYNVNTDSEEII